MIMKYVARCGFLSKLLVFASGALYA